MQCPYCKKLMQEGYIGLGKENLIWTPKGRKRNFWINHPNEEEITLVNLNYLKGCKCKVYRCPVCKIQIIDENDKKV